MGDIDAPISQHYCLELKKVVEVVQHLSLARNLDRITEIVRHEARQLSGADGASFVLREGDFCYYADEEAISPLWKGQRFPMDSCVSGWVMRHGQPVAIRDIYADSRVPVEAYRPTFVKSMLLVPIRASDPIGVIGNYWAHEHQPTDEEIYLLQALANTTAVALENVRLFSNLERRVEERTESLEREIADRRQAERALQDNERRLALALEASASAVWELDVASRVVRGNALLYAMLGYEPGELTTADEWIALIREDKRHGVPEMVGELIEGKRNRYNFEVPLLSKGGNWRWILSQAVVAERNAQGQAIRLVGTHTDITGRKEAETEVQRLNAELERRVQERTAELEQANETLLHTNLDLQHFAHAMAYDLQTPLRSIAGFTQLLRQAVKQYGDAKIDEWAAQVIHNTQRLQTLIQEVLSYSRLEGQGLPFAEVDMDQLLAEVLGSLQSLICNTSAEICSEPLPKVSADRTQMSQLLQNLIENGIKYNDSKPPRLTVSCEDKDGVWIFSVRDNGMGIDPKHHERIFEMFKRLHTYTQIPGTGIGLALCRRIVERHGGRIWVESEPGKGCVFQFTLPNRGQT